MNKSKFNLSHMHSTTLDAGYLVPFACIPTLPNDTFFLSNKSFLRATPMLAPLMHRVFLFTQYWYVPYRLLWENWEEAITGGNSGTVAPTFPTIKAPSSGGFAVGSLADYLGFPINQPGIEVSAFPFRAVAEIWNSRYRDEDLQTEVPVSYEDGLDTITSTELLSPCWKRDKFTKSRASTQRGSQISVPIGSGQGGSVVEYGAYSSTSSFTIPISAFSFSSSLPAFTGDFVITVEFLNIEVTNSTNSSFTWKGSGKYYKSPFDAQDQLLGTFTFSYDVAGNVTRLPFQDVPYVIPRNFLIFGASSWEGIGIQASSTIVAYSQEVNTLGSFEVRDLRLASALQRYQERSLQWGNRYEEMIMREFGIKPRDARIDRPEYLGGGKSMLNISEVLQTAEGTDTGVGTMRGHGVGSLKNRRIKFKSPEHGVIIAFVSIRPEPVYTQGIDREWLKRSRLDFYTPELASVGMQEIYQQELYATSDNKDVIFGYTDKYQEYRYIAPRVTGEFRTGNYNYWNMARNFSAPPVINADFINMASSAEAFKRPFAERTQHSYLLMLRNEVTAYRAVAKRAKNILK